MIFLSDLIKEKATNAINSLFPEAQAQLKEVAINETKPEFNGDYTIVLFPFVKKLKQNPEALGQQLGAYLVANDELFTAFEVIKGFLNLTVKDSYLVNFTQQQYLNTSFGTFPSSGKRMMVEYSSPNTNKPLHFGHLRNNFLGWSVSEILKANGHEVIKANLVNDRGIHICKSMIAWMRYANGATPESTGIKGDHLVGDYYVKFNDAYKAEVEELVNAGKTKEEAEKEAPIMLEAQELLRKWEAGEKETFDLWAKMNGWVYEGFDATYKALGLDFDKYYYESNTYLLGKQLVEEGLKKGILFKKENGSIWIDLTAEGLDEKLLLRADGTSVYMTQDLGTAKLKYDEYKTDKSLYVIADEQNYHMQVLQLILKKLEEPCADGIYHLSYGMVELPSGRMKSREGTVVDADDMIAEMIALAKEQTETAGKTDGFTQEELEKLYDTIGLGSLKFYLLRVEPRKKMIFNPAESIDLHGFTAAFIQYAHARICSILRKNEGWENAIQHADFSTLALAPLEKSLILQIEQLPAIIQQAGAEYNPSLICNYTFKLAQTFNSFFDKHSIIRAEDENIKAFRLALAKMTANTLKTTMSLLGINVPERM
jgi:arginyl-tRNA synthetase